MLFTQGVATKTPFAQVAAITSLTMQVDAPDKPKSTPKVNTTGIQRGMEVRIMRPESYWFQEIGKVATIDQKEGSRYSAVVRFDKVNYQGVNTNNFSVDELVPVTMPEPQAKAKAGPRTAAPKMSAIADSAKAIS